MNVDVSCQQKAVQRAIFLVNAATADAIFCKSTGSSASLLRPPPHQLTAQLLQLRRPGFPLFAEANVRAAAEHLSSVVLSSVLPETFTGRFSIAGGAFKSLLICGTEPNDIDVWPASEEDRVAFIFAINQQQQQRQADTSVAAAGSPPRRVSIEENKPYNTIIRSPTLPCPLEVTFKVGRLESILPSFDICLAVVGAEFEGRRVLRVVVDEGAQRSVDQGQILLVRGYDALPPTRKVLNTIHRMRRYAAETGLASMPAEEGRAWALFEAADPAIQQRMLSDLRVFAKGGGAGSSVQALGEEAERRLLALVDQQRKQ